MSRARPGSGPVMGSCRRWLLAAGLGLGTLGFVYARFVEPQRVRLDRYVIPIAQPGLPPDGLTILHLSDLHCRAGGAVQAAKLARLQRLLAGEAYDLLALTGDLIHDDAGLPAALALVRGLRPRLAAFSCPGNRDYWHSGLRALIAPAEDAGAPGRSPPGRFCPEGRGQRAVGAACDP